jgi:hypothetical protein
MTALAPLPIETIGIMSRLDLCEVADEYRFGHEIHTRMSTEEIRTIVKRHAQGAKDETYSATWAGIGPND